tara:strand:+ start:3105 stop:3971 length:867 start_codon:yes stop_codon:yes gene_type:complete
MKLNISLYIPVYNGESTIESVLKSAFKLNPSPDEIIVVNDGSSDNTSNILENYKDKITVFKNNTNMGLAYSRNVGISKAKHENVASLDSDVEVAEDWLKNLLEIKTKFQSAICGGILIEKYKDKNVYNFWRHIHATQNNFGENDIENLGMPVSGSNSLLSKSAWKKAGGYDEQYKTNGEDTTFCQKLLKHNYKISYSCNAKAFHLRNDNLMSLVNSVRRAYIYGAGLKKPSFMRFIQRTIRHFKNFILYSLKDIRILKFSLIFINLVIFLNLFIKEFIGLIKNKSDYV